MNPGSAAPLDHEDGSTLGAYVDYARHINRAAKPSGGPRVLCLTEDVDLALLLEETLSLHGIDLLLRPAGGADAEELIATGVVALIVDEGTIDAVRALGARPVGSLRPEARPLIIALLAEERTTDRLRAFGAGADHVLGRGSDAVTLGDRVAGLIEARDEQPLRALLVDDDRSQLVICESILRRFGVDALSCQDSMEALDLLHSHRPDVVLVDIHMPGIDGLALAQQIAECGGAEHVAVLFLSGDQQADVAFAAAAVGSDQFLHKPIRPRDLVRTVIAHAKKARKRGRRLAGGAPAIRRES